MSMVRGGSEVVKSVLGILLGAGVVLGGSYVVNRIRERQEVDLRLDRLDRLVEKLEAGRAESADPSEKWEA